MMFPSGDFFASAKADAADPVVLGAVRQTQRVARQFGPRQSRSHSKTNCRRASCAVGPMSLLGSMKPYHPNLKPFPEKEPPSKEEFESFVERLPWSGCWIWMRCDDAKGYGEFKRRQIKRKAHRYSYQLYRGEIPDGLLVCHHCDTPACVNQEHLFVGTYKDNAVDCARKGRTRGGWSC